MKTIPLTRGFEAKVDDQDYDWLAKFRWYFDGKYAARNLRKSEGRGKIRMHVAIVKPPRGAQVDHRNGDKLDYQRHNLRLATHGNNVTNQGPRSTNSLGVKGVVFRPNINRFTAQISINHRSVHLGCFRTLPEAAACYAQACQRLHGEFYHP